MYEIFLILKRIRRDIIINAGKSSSEVTAVLARLKRKIEFSLSLLKNTRTSIFAKIRLVEARLFHVDIRTDMTKLIVDFRNF